MSRMQWTVGEAPRAAHSYGIGGRCDLCPIHHQRLLGSGGMGEARPRSAPSVAAPRCVESPSLPRAMTADSEFRARFNREADLISTLWHPNIVQVHDRGEFDGQLWIAMDYVEGADAL